MAEEAKIKQFARNVLARLSEDKLFNPARSSCGVLTLTTDQNVITVVSKNVRLAGLRPGDVIRTVNNQPVSTHNELREELAKKGLADAVKLGIHRNGKTIQIEMKCQDTREFKRLTIEMYRTAADGQWNECISRSYALERLLTPAYFIADMRTKCSEAKRMLSGRLPNNADAQLVYDANRIMIKEAGYSQSVENDRGKVLSAISWLKNNGFQEFANDLQTQLNEASNAGITP